LERVHKVKSKERIKKNAEVFTPDFLVNEMLDKLPEENWEEGKTFCDPACGDGQFLVNVLHRKLKANHDPLNAIQSTYGCDIMQDNIRICRMRLLAILKEYTKITKDHIKAVLRNIVWLNMKKYPNGSLDYDFSFKNGINRKDIARWLEYVNNGILDNFDSEELPVHNNAAPKLKEVSILDLMRKAKSCQ